MFAQQTEEDVVLVRVCVCVCERGNVYVRHCAVCVILACLNVCLWVGASVCMQILAGKDVCAFMLYFVTPPQRTRFLRQ